ncbi:DUF2726 domain-containing protein [Gallaecimonas xiamenensis]|uniref:DUF2726 domain-containing protein n=1 Tax=Gallaecimonas xiamenensis 3-C-1 TaxID=745411 RepID=K2IZE7_9GAMM|nr:DUF2726 domain-containing protein [Gallaecimonas xiamenensis]EKE67932.1 hypothetical protein B3C1_17862 [Gallaecimonas xiamenensis 3-C-1]
MLSDELNFLLPFLLAAAGFFALSLLLYLWRRLRMRRPFERQPLLSEEEVLFLRRLDSACGEDFRAFTKVRWADVIGVQPRFKGSDYQRVFERICAKRLDFVLCYPDLSVAMVVEREASNPNRARRKRDAELVRICDQIGLPLLVVKDDPSLDALHLRAHIEKRLNRLPPQAPVRAVEASEERQERTQEVSLPPISALAPLPKGERLCPKCNAVMQKRKVAKGKYEGQSFWACSAYPLCKTVQPIKEETADKPVLQASIKDKEVVTEGLFTLRATR